MEHHAVTQRQLNCLKSYRPTHNVADKYEKLLLRLL